MLPDQVSNPGPLTYESSALPTALHGPAGKNNKFYSKFGVIYSSFSVFFEVLFQSESAVQPMCHRM